MTPVRTGTTITSREFSQEAGRAKKQALKGPVFITDRGRPAHVLMTIEDYQRLAGARRGRSVADVFAQDDPDADFEFVPPRLTGPFSRPIDFD